MKRRAWAAGWVGLALLLPTILGLWIAGIWTHSDRLGATGGVLLIPLIGGTIAMSIWSEDSMPARNLPRAARRQLRDEESRIRLAAEIARMEREAGLS